MAVPFAYVADAMVIESITVRIQDFLSTMMLPSIVVPASVEIGDGQQVVYHRNIAAFPPASKNTADFFRTRFDCVPTRENERLSRYADNPRMRLRRFSGSHG